MSLNKYSALSEHQLFKKIAKKKFEIIKRQDAIRADEVADAVAGGLFCCCVTPTNLYRKYKIKKLKKEIHMLENNRSLSRP